MSEIIQLNRFSKLHNGKDIFFCKTDFLQKDFDIISKLNHDVILISGNSDIAITNKIAKTAPQNISTWFCQNNECDDPRVVSLPLGIENTFECKRFGHGVAWDFALEKNKILSSIFNKKITGETFNLVYANFNVNTSPIWRNKIKDVCLKSNHITFEKSNLSYPEFISKILSHEAVVCPCGNGVDTHRVYETLYANRIPIVFSHGQGYLYKTLYKFLPVVLLENPEQLLDKQHIINNIKVAKNKSNEKIKFSHWRKRILANL